MSQRDDDPTVPGPAPRNAEEKLRRTNRFLDAIIENIPDMIFVKDAETLLFQRFNRAGEELLGWSREELLGKTDHDFYPKEQADFFHAKDRETLRSGELVDIEEEPITTRRKGLRWLHTKKVPVYDDDGTPLYLLGISEDITARKLAEERARALERELSSIVVQATDAIVTWSEDGVVQSWNPAAEALYGIPQSRAVGATIDSFVPASARAGLRDAQTRLLLGEKLPAAETYRLREGYEIEVEERLFLIHGAGDEPIRIASIARDVEEVARLRRAAEILVARDDRVGEEDDETRSQVMRDVLAAADVAAMDGVVTMLFLGETGVGKSWLAHRVHRRSPRAGKPFFEINCASLSPQLVESELFGHERGAFTGATSQKRGLVEATDGGTLFLDEVGELPATIQAQLLTFLDSRTFRRVGGTRSLTANVRILAATNLDLERAAAEGRFRRDLYYRLSVVPVRIPSLRERREEIPELARALLRDLASRASGRRGAKLGRGVTAALQRYAWPGNVRELRNALERALILSRGGTLELQHFPPEMRGQTAPDPDSQKLEDVQRAHVLRVLREAGGNRTKAAELLGISRSTLKRMLASLREHGPDPSE